MSAQAKGIFQQLADDLERRRPAQRRRRRRHVDDGMAIHLQYDGGFHRPASPALSLSRTHDDPLAAVLGAGGAWTVEAFEEEAQDPYALIYGAGQLQEEAEAEDPYGAEAASFSEVEPGAPIDAPVWGTAELEALEETGPGAMSQDVEAAIWGTAELEGLEPDAAPANAPVPAPEDAAGTGSASPSPAASPGGADLTAAAYSRIARETEDPETMAFANDLQAILGGRKQHPSVPEQTAPNVADEEEPPAPFDQRPVSSGFSHADFDRWGSSDRSLSTATSYNLGSFDLSRQFDNELDAAERRSRGRAGIASAASVSPREEYAEDVAQLAQPVPPATARPAPDASPAPPAAAVPPFGPSVPIAPVGARSATGIGPAGTLTTEIPLDPGTGGMSIDERMLEVGDIVVSTTDHISSRIIRAGTGAPVSHALIYIGGGQVVEAIDVGVVLRSLGEAVAGSNLAVAFRKPELTPEQGLLVRDFVGQQIGKPFNNVGIVRQAGFQLDRRVFCSGKVGDALERCLSWVGSVNLGTSDNGSFFCSELVVAAFAHAGAPLTTRPPNWTSPGDIAELRLNGRLSYVGHLKAPPLGP